MLIRKETENVISSGLGSGNAFSIAASAKAFEVLSSNLYQNKLLAVIREISCNAADAHKAVGKSLADIEVHLPTAVEPYFEVKDYGPGLSHDDVLSLYTTYFRSTKDNDNSLIGGFGLGSKAPFALTDQFTVTSRHGGMVRTYICYKDNGLPRVNIVGEQTLDDPSDTGLSVKVASKDSYGFETNAQAFFRWWPILPKITAGYGFKVKPAWDGASNVLKSVNEIDGHPEWALLPSPQDSVVFMGLVAYQLNLNAIPNLPADISKLLYGTGIFLNMPVGEASISPSREALSYDPSTCAAIIARLKQVARDAVGDYKATVAKLPTLLAARQYVYDPYNRGVRLMMEKMADAGTLTWNGKAIKAQVHMPCSDLGDGVSIDMVAKKSYHKKPQRWVQNATFYDHAANSGDTIFWSATAPRNHIATLTEHFTGSNSWKAIIFKGGNYADICKAFEERGLPKPIDYASLPKPAKVPATRSTAPRTMGYAFNLTDLSYERSTQALPLTGGGLFVRFTEGHPNTYVMRMLKGLSVYDAPVLAGKNIIGVSGAVLAKSKTLAADLDKHGWQEVNADWFQANVPEAWLEATFSKVGAAAWLCNQRPLPPDYLRKAVAANNWPGAEDFFKLVAPYVTPTSSGYYFAMSDYADTFSGFASATQKQAIAKRIEVVRQLKDAWEAFLAAHPLLRYVDKGQVPYDMLNDYINR